MTRYVLWRRGLNGPEIAILNSYNLDQYDRENKITNPVEIKPDEEEYDTAALAILYPPPPTNEPK
jgi:hypothetical protein